MLVHELGQQAVAAVEGGRPGVDGEHQAIRSRCAAMVGCTVVDDYRVLMLEIGGMFQARCKL